MDEGANEAKKEENWLLFAPAVLEEIVPDTSNVKTNKNNKHMETEDKVKPIWFSFFPLASSKTFYGIASEYVQICISIDQLVEHDF